MCQSCVEYYTQNPLHKATAADVLKYGATPHRIKYLDDLEKEYHNYISTLIFNVFDGLAKNLGVKDPDKLASKPPYVLQKGFLTGLKSIGQKLKGFFGRKLDKPKPFLVKGKPVYVQGKQMTQKEYEDFEKQVTTYLKPYLKNANEEIVIKSMMMAMASARAERQGQQPKQYGKKSYKQIEEEDFSGYVPDSIESVKKRYDVPKQVMDAFNREHIRAAQYTQGVNEKVRNAIRAQVVQAHKEGLTPKELASNLYWMKTEDKEMKKISENPHTAEQLIRDWHLTAVTEIAYIHEAGKTAIYEGQAADSLINKAEPVYFVFGGSGRCDWCGPRQGTVVRQIPLSAVGNDADDSLGSRGITDEHTDIAIWQGKSNYGYKKAHWRIATPAHPLCMPLGVEVMTDKGWVLLDLLQSGDMVYSINPDTLEMSYVRNIKTFRYQYTGEMFHFKARGYDLTVTPDHNMLIERRLRYKDKPQKRIREIVKAKDIKWAEFMIPRAGIWRDNEIGTHREYLIASLYGWYCSEGSIQNKNSIFISQYKSGNRNVIYELLTDLCIEFSIKKYGFLIKGDIAKQVIQDVPDLQPCRKTPVFIKNSPKNVIQSFLDAFCLGDGSQRKRDCFGYQSNERVYYTTSKYLMADICEMILKTGKSVHTSIITKKGTETKHHNGTYTSNHDVFCIRESKSKNVLFCSDNESSINKIKFDGEVGCPSLEKNHVFLFRNNGTIGWTGNCRDTFIRFYPKSQMYNKETNEIQNKMDAQFTGPKQSEFWAELETEQANDQLEREKNIKKRNEKRGYK